MVMISSTLDSIDLLRRQAKGRFTGERPGGWSGFYCPIEKALPRVQLV